MATKWKLIDEDEEKDTQGKELMWEMANIPHRLHKELPSNIWISAKNTKHGPRIKIQKNDSDAFQFTETFSMTVSDTPKIIGDVGRELTPKDIEYFRNFVLRNKDALVAYWNGEIATEEVLPRLVY